MTERTPDDPYRNITVVQGDPRGLLMILIEYEEQAPMDAQGQLLRCDLDRNGVIETVLRTNAPLSALWTSPEGSQWLGAATGEVWTTAPVSWPSTLPSRLISQVVDDRWQWRVVQLPDLSKKQFSPNIQYISGVSDNLLFASTFEGAIYCCERGEWREQETGVEEPLGAISACAENCVYCVGFDGIVLFFDGATWAPVVLPLAEGDMPILTGVHVASSNDVWITARDGRVFYGGETGFSLIGQVTGDVYGLKEFAGRKIIAARSGAWEVGADGLSSLRDTFQAIGLWNANGRCYFVPVEQPEPQVVEYDPQSDKPWVMRSFPI